jgi:hypothetical protein
LSYNINNLNKGGPAALFFVWLNRNISYHQKVLQLVIAEKLPVTPQCTTSDFLQTAVSSLFAGVCSVRLSND